MSTKIEIVNLALTMFGHRRIDSLQISNAITRTVNTVYNPTLEDCLTEVDWGFARRQARLVLIAEEEDGEQPIDGWTYLYAQPAKCLKPRKVYPKGYAYKAKQDDFLETQNPANGVKALATDVAEAYCQFTIKIEDTTQFDPAFVKAVAAGLASELALPLTKDKQLAGAMLQIYRGRLSEAARKNATRSRDKKPVSSSFIDARA